MLRLGRQPAHYPLRDLSEGAQAKDGSPRQHRHKYRRLGLPCLPDAVESGRSPRRSEHEGGPSGAIAGPGVCGWKEEMMDKTLITQLQGIAGKEAVLHTPEDLAVYSYDGAFDHGCPEVAVLPTSTDQVRQIVRLAAENRIPVVTRGMGT